MDSRTTILNRIKNALIDVDKSKLQEPETPEIWAVVGKTKEELTKEFANNLKAVAGEAIVCQNVDDAVDKMVEVMSSLTDVSCKTPPFELGVYDSDFTQMFASKLLERLPDWKMLFAPNEPAVDPKTYETMTASLVTPFALLTDTGSCAIEGRSAFERLLCYLSPVCFVLAKTSQLRENLPHAWSEIEVKMQNPHQHGEIVLVTGPSRTADIEKKLVLGVHGPQKLIVFLVKD